MPPRGALHLGAVLHLEGCAAPGGLCCTWKGAASWAGHTFMQGPHRWRMPPRCYPHTVRAASTHMLLYNTVLSRTCY